MQLRRIGQTPLLRSAARESEQRVLHSRMAHRRLSLMDCERALVQALALLVCACGAVSVGEVVEVSGDARVLLSESLLGESERVLKRRLRLRVISRVVGHAP